MEAYDPTELLVICESILEDGEISGDELYNLAAWLNEHREACFHWPGNVLVGPLQEVWADGKVTKTEMRKIGRLLLRIQRNWARTQSEALIERVAKLANDIIGLDHNEPWIPPLPIQIRVNSLTAKGVQYEVNLNGPSCTCPDWVTQRSGLPQGHLNRCCKHVLDALSQIKSDEDWPGWLVAFIDSAYPPHPQHRWKTLKVGGQVVLISSAPAGWANVYAEEDENGDSRFGYNIRERRWAYGAEPLRSGPIRRAIEEL